MNMHMHLHLQRFVTVVGLGVGLVAFSGVALAQESVTPVINAAMATLAAIAGVVIGRWWHGG